VNPGQSHSTPTRSSGFPTSNPIPLPFALSPRVHGHVDRNKREVNETNHVLSRLDCLWKQPPHLKKGKGLICSPDCMRGFAGPDSRDGRLLPLLGFPSMGRRKHVNDPLQEPFPILPRPGRTDISPCRTGSHGCHHSTSSVPIQTLDEWTEHSSGPIPKYSPSPVPSPRPWQSRLRF
jgi:hypothetical protein